MRTRVITEYHYGQARRSATRAGLAVPDASRDGVRAARDCLDRALERHGLVVDEFVLEIAAGRLEDVSSQQLRDVTRDINAELQRRRDIEANA